MKSPLVWIGKVPRASVCSVDARVDRFRRVLQGSSGFWSLTIKKWSGLETTSGMAELLKRIVVFTSGGAGVCFPLIWCVF